MPSAPPAVNAQQGPPWGPPPPPPGGGGYGSPPGGFGSPPGGYGAPPGGGGYGNPPGPPGAPPGAKPITGSPETMALHAMTIDPRTGLPRGEKPPASTAAVMSLVCGILLCLGPFTGVTAIVAGIVARSRAREAPDRVGGGGMAAFGIALGCFNLFVSAAGLAYFLYFALLGGG